MASIKSPENNDLAALAAEACELWQEHLAAYANDPQAKEELMRLLEPQRQLFAGWAGMMQTGAHETGAEAKTGSKRGANPTGTAPAGAASDDGALRLAQLAHRMAQLEQHVAELEKRLGSPSGGAGKSRKKSGPAKS